MLRSSSKILSLSKLLSLRRAWAAKKKKVVFTNGVFDLLHAGHVELLEKARSLGNILIVGVNSDASARRLEKGPGRPFNTWRDRARVLAAMNCVDTIVGFEEDTPERLLGRIRPDVLVKGADYRPDQVAGRQFAKKTVLIRLIKGYSTTALAAKVARSASR